MYRINLTPQNSDRYSVVTIGNFDGVHLGHMCLLGKLNQIGAKHNLRRIVITFEPSPADFFNTFNGVARQPRLSLIRDKLGRLKGGGILDELVVLKFNRTLAETTADEFVEKYLIQQLNIKHIVIGHDFKFGKNALGNISNFKAKNIVTTIVEPFQIDGTRVSSSVIRQCALTNDLTAVKRYLGHNLHYTSRVIYGNQLGRKYGVPTINLCLGNNVPALWGIYLAYVYIDGVKYNAVASIGKNPTVSNVDSYKLEAHLLDVDLNLYGKIATIEILSFMRSEVKFVDLNSLFTQIHQDISAAKDYFKSK